PAAAAGAGAAIGGTSRGSACIGRGGVSDDAWASATGPPIDKEYQDQTLRTQGKLTRPHAAGSPGRARPPAPHASRARTHISMLPLAIHRHYALGAPAALEPAQT